MFQNRRKFSMILLALVASLFSLGTVSKLQAGGGGGSQPRLEGILVKPIDADRVASVRRTNGTVVTVYVPTTAKIERNGVTVQLNSFKANDRVQARFTADGSTVVKFEGTGA